MSDETLQVICAWCGADLDTKEGNAGISHGICTACAKKLELEVDLYLAKKV